MIAWQYPDLGPYPGKRIRDWTHVAIGWLVDELPRGPRISPTEIERVVESLLGFAKRRQPKLGVRAAVDVCFIAPCLSVQEFHRRLDAGLQITAEDCAQSFGEIFVPHLTRSKTLYCAPNLIFHFMKEHGYRPPQEFLDALEKFQPSDVPELEW